APPRDAAGLRSAGDWPGRSAVPPVLAGTAGSPRPRPGLLRPLGKRRWPGGRRPARRPDRDAGRGGGRGDRAGLRVGGLVLPSVRSDRPGAAGERELAGGLPASALPPGACCRAVGGRVRRADGVVHRRRAGRRPSGGAAGALPPALAPVLEVEL